MGQSLHARFIASVLSFAEVQSQSFLILYIKPAMILLSGLVMKLIDLLLETNNIYVVVIVITIFVQVILLLSLSRMIFLEGCRNILN
jgi:hypothetical protein